MGRPPRPRAVAHRRPDRPANLRAARPHPRRYAARYRRARPDGRQRQKGTRRAADQADRRGAPRLAARNQRPTRKPAVSLARRRHAHPRRDRAAPRPTRPDRTARLPVAAIQADHDAHDASHRGDEPARPPASTPPRSRCGSATSRNAPRTSTCTPTSSSSNARWTGSRLLTAAQAATEHPTLCSPSSRAYSPPALPGWGILVIGCGEKTTIARTYSRFVQSGSDPPQSCAGASVLTAALDRIPGRWQGSVPTPKVHDDADVTVRHSCVSRSRSFPTDRAIESGGNAILARLWSDR